MAGGLSMAQLERIVRLVAPAPANGGVHLDLDLIYGAELGEFEALLVADLHESLDSGCVLMVNFLRTLHGRRGGHWSPIGGMATSASGEQFVLLLDVAAHRLGLHWIPLRLMAICCCTLNIHGTPRGYIRVAAGEQDTCVGTKVEVAHHLHLDESAPNFCMI